MRLLFIGPGYPGVEGTGSGSGIGTYLREITLGLTARGHECHVVVWEDSESKCSGQESRPYLGFDLHEVKGVRVCLLRHSYWPIIERAMPDSRDVWNMRRLVRRLDAEYHYDWIEIQSEEGIGIEVQRTFPNKTILRAHTTLMQMVEYKGEKATGHEVHALKTGRLFDVQMRKLRARLRRERKSFEIAKRIITHSSAHADEIQRLFGGIVEPWIVHHGIGAASKETRDCPSHPDTFPPAERKGGDGVELHGVDSPRSDVVRPMSQGSAFHIPTFLIIGTADRRKGFDRIRPVLETYATRYGLCRAIIVSSAPVGIKAEFGLSADQVSDAKGWVVEWKTGLSTDQLDAEYKRATVYLHLARYESFGIPLVEAACHGVPVVSTRVGIAAELLTGELARFLVDGSDIAGIADALHSAVQDCVSVGGELLAVHENKFTREHMTESFLNRIRGL